MEINVSLIALLLTTAGMYAMFGLGVQLQFGYAGLLNFGATGFMIIAAYAMAISVIRLGLPLWAASVLGLAASMFLGLAMALPTVRLRTVSFGFVSIAIAEILRNLAMDLNWLTGGTVGSINMLGPTRIGSYNTDWQTLEDSIASLLQPVLGTSATRSLSMALLAWVSVLLVMLVLEALVRSPWGRVAKAVRDDEDLAAAIGKNVFAYKVAALSVGGLVCGWAGLLLAFQVSAFAPTDFTPLIAFYAFVVVLLGGTGRMWTTPIGALVFALILQGTRYFGFWPFSLIGDADRQYLRLLIIGAVLVGIMMFRPQGLLGKKEEVLL